MIIKSSLQLFLIVANSSATSWKVFPIQPDGNDVYTSLPSGCIGKTFHEVADELATIKKSCNDDFIIIKRMEVVILSTKPLQLQP